MVEKIITTRRGVYGILNVTVPLTMKRLMLERAKRLGYKRAEFLRLALLTGFSSLTKTIEVLTPAEGEHGDHSDERSGVSAAGVEAVMEFKGENA